MKLERKVTEKNIQVKPESGIDISKYEPPKGINMNKQETIQQFFSLLQEDESYRRSWKDNIAMAFKDEYRRRPRIVPTNEDVHSIANNAADNFLNLLIK